MKLRKEVGEGDLMPRFYGLAWKRWDRMTAVCYPIPINWVTRLARSFWFIVVSPGRDSFIESIERRAFDNGYRLGRESVKNQQLIEIMEEFKAVRGLVCGSRGVK